MSQLESKEFQAPEGTYQRLTADRKLGNAYTKRVLWVTDVPGESGLSIHLRIQEGRSNTYRYYNFAIDQEDTIVDFRAKRQAMEYQAPIEELAPPSFAEILREISAAEKIQPTLKR